MKYYIIAGEASGDLHAASLMEELSKLDKDAHFRCWGGDRMEKQGGELIKHYRDLAFMGFVEVVANLRTILNNISFCKDDILKYNPDAVVLVDYPGFNLRIAEFAYNKGIKVFYYISPQVWAWRKGRVHRIKRIVDKMFVILPFEKEFYKKYDYHNVEFVGHPLLDVIEKHEFLDRDNFIKKNNLDGRPIITLLPGSRRQEIKLMLSVMLTMIPVFRDYQFVVGAAPSVEDMLYLKSISGFDVKLIRDQTYNLLKNSEAAIVTSGTATLETALIGVPEVVCYKGGYLSFQIAKRLVDVDYISLVNLIMGREIVKELIQTKLNMKNLKKELDTILFNSQKKERMIQDYQQLREKLGGSGASENTARMIINHLKK